MRSYSTCKSGILSFFLAILASGCCKKDQVNQFNKDLYSSEASVRNAAALELARCSEYAHPSVTRLIALLYDENVGVQSSSAYALRKINSPQAKAALTQIEQNRASRRLR